MHPFFLSLWDHHHHTHTHSHSHALSSASNTARVRPIHSKVSHQTSLLLLCMGGGKAILTTQQVLATSCSCGQTPIQICAEACLESSMQYSDLVRASPPGSHPAHLTHNPASHPPPPPLTLPLSTPLLIAHPLLLAPPPPPLSKPQPLCHTP